MPISCSVFSHSEARLTLVSRKRKVNQKKYIRERFEDHLNRTKLPNKKSKVKLKKNDIDKC